MFQRLTRCALAVVVSAAALPSFARIQTPAPSNAPPSRQVLPQDTPAARPGAAGSNLAHSGDVTNNPAAPGTAGASVYRRPGAPAQPLTDSSGRPLVRGGGPRAERSRAPAATPVRAQA